MKVLSLAVESTFVGHRKYFHCPSQVLAFLGGVFIEKSPKVTDVNLGAIIMAF